jgi:hypothetical protein
LSKKADNKGSFHKLLVGKSREMAAPALSLIAAAMVAIQAYNEYY